MNGEAERMVTRDKILSELNLLECKAKMLHVEPLTIYLIGGGNLALRGLKDATKDIDIVISEGKFIILQKILESPIAGLPIYRSLYRSQWEYDLGMAARYAHPLEEFNLDIFVKRTKNGLYLSENMIARAEIPEEFSSHEIFEIYLVSREDLFLFKSITSIERDVEDLITVVRRTELRNNNPRA